MLRNLFGNFVTFERVLKGANLEAEIVGDTYEHQNLVGAIAM